MTDKSNNKPTSPLLFDKGFPKTFWAFLMKLSL